MTQGRRKAGRAQPTPGGRLGALPWAQARLWEPVAAAQRVQVGSEDVGGVWGTAGRPGPCQGCEDQDLEGGVQRGLLPEETPAFWGRGRGWWSRDM